MRKKGNGRILYYAPVQHNKLTWNSLASFESDASTAVAYGLLLFLS